MSKYGVTQKQLIAKSIAHPRLLKMPETDKKNPEKLWHNLQSLCNRGQQHDILRESVKLAFRSNDLKILQVYWPLIDTADFYWNT